MINLISISSRFWREHEHRILRLVVDEAHQILTCLNYRSLFSKVKTFAGFNIQKIYLSASLPPRLLPRFLAETGLPNSTVIIRGPTHQLNLRYHVITLEPINTNIYRFIIDIAHIITTTFLGPAKRGIIFCTSKTMVELVGASFNNCISHSDLTSDLRMHNEHSWFIGEKQWIVATTGLIHGVDCQDVGCTIFIELPYGALNLYQGFGRAGRDSKPALAFLISSLNNHYTTTKQQEDDTCIEEGDAWRRNIVECRRFGLSQLLDGKSVRCADLSMAEKCDICQPDTPLIQAIQSVIPDLPSHQPHCYSPPSSILEPTTDDEYGMGDWDDDTLMQIDLDMYEHPTAIKTNQISSSIIGQQLTISNPHPSMSVQIDAAHYRQRCVDKIAKSEEISHMVSLLSGTCVVCWAWKKKMVKKTMDHRPFISCKEPQDGFLNHLIGWIAFKKMIKLKYGLYCWKCGLPQGKFLPYSHPSFKVQTPMRCPFEDFVILIIWHIRHNLSTWKLACQAFNTLTEQMSLIEFGNWVQIETGVDAFYNGLELVYWFWLTHPGI